MNRDKLSTYMLDFFPLVMRKFFKDMNEKSSKADSVTRKVLYHISKDDGKSMKHYAEEMSISKPNFTKATNSLIEKDLIIRKRDVKDRRVVKLYITEEGKAVIESKMEMIKKVFLERIEVLSDEDVETLLENFESIAEIFNKLND